MPNDRDRRLTIAEMAQIAGRAGRHQKDGTFGTLGLGTESGAAFSEEEIEAIEDHRFRPLDFVHWRNAELDFTDVGALIRSLEAKSDDPLLRAAPEAIDLMVLKLLAEDPAIVADLGDQDRGHNLLVEISDRALLAARSEPAAAAVIPSVSV